ncbi:hypothetical protein AAFF_G00111220 [Aldrovandia affinis]|uniref:Uncharacterized protein n=1 Tax=Aldrovandia affinis TaxID=143900 RepID=A0AAD7RTZ0_9TELE|nr:hypothetical protein AAFF_G00111220 [Aldrovandia affinis]
MAAAIKQWSILKSVKAQSIDRQSEDWLMCHIEEQCHDSAVGLRYPLLGSPVFREVLTERAVEQNAMSSPEPRGPVRSQRPDPDHWLTKGRGGNRIVAWSSPVRTSHASAYSSARLRVTEMRLRKRWKSTK